MRHSDLAASSSVLNAERISGNVDPIYIIRRAHALADVVNSIFRPARKQLVARKTNANNVVRTDSLAHPTKYFETEPHPILEGASVLVLALIG
jgi:hypothetical protein